jgi:acyl-CoA synthetase (NDP forming)
LRAGFPERCCRSIPNTKPSTGRRASRRFPSWSRGNPIDILGDASAQRFGRALEICFSFKILDGVLVTLAPQALTDPLSVAETLAAAIQERRFPVFACWMGGKRIATAVDVLNAAGVALNAFNKSPSQL